MRTKPRPNKLRLTRQERWHRVRDVYAVRAGRRVDKLRVLLVDDVFATGATLDAYARPLRQAGAASVPGMNRGPSDAGVGGSRVGGVAGRTSGMSSYGSQDGWVSRLRGLPRSPAAERRPLAGSPTATSRPGIMQEPVLVLNATFEPINVTAVRRAMVLLLKGVAQAEELNHAEVHSATKALRVPSVIRLLAYRHIPQQTRALSRKNILLRDHNTCQFCGRGFPAAELTLDHVVPRSRGGHSSWENLVACCYQCNNNKGDRTPEEAGLQLVRRPRPFTLHTSRQLMRLIGHKDEKWRKYLFY